MISPSVTTSRFSLAISSPITLLPGMTSTTRTESTDSARARSLASAVIWLAFTPGAGREGQPDHRARQGPGARAVGALGARGGGHSGQERDGTGNRQREA